MAANVVVLNGRICNDLELKQTNNGKTYLKFSVACRATEEKTDFIPCTVWGKTAEFVSRYFSKGDGIILTGSIVTGTWTDQEGKNRSSFEVFGKDVGFPDGKKSSQAVAAAAPVLAELPDGEDGELPF